LVFFFLPLITVISAVNFYALGQKYLHFPAISTTTVKLSKGKFFILPLLIGLIPLLPVIMIWPFFWSWLLF